MKRALAMVSLCGLLLTSLSCGSDKGSSGGENSLPKATQSTVPQNPDRDQAAVINTLNRLNPCDLLPSIATLPATTLQPLHSLSNCSRSNDELSVTARLGQPSTHQMRFGQQPVVVAGVHGYQVPSKPDACSVALPVSFTLAVVFSATDKRASADACAVARAAATAGVAVLAGSRLQPVARWDACSVLSRALDGGTEVNRAALGDCSTMTTDEHLALDYSVSRGSDSFQIAGKPALLRPADKDCSVHWTQGPVGPGGDPAFKLIGKVQAATCDRATELATKAATIMNDPAPATPVISGALTLRADEPDSPYSGGCVDLQDPRGCEPYRPVDLPKGAEEIARQAHGNPHVNCALAIAAVGKHLGKTFRPVYRTTQDGSAACTFVEPTHAVQIDVELTSATNSRLELERSKTHFTIADRPAERTDASTYTVVRVAPTDQTMLRLSESHRVGGRGPDILPVVTTVLAGL